MSTSFPAGIDTFVNPAPGDPQNSPGALNHATQHDNENDAIHALEVKVGINGSADTSSLDYKVATNTSGIATNTSNITANSNAISALQAQPTVTPQFFQASGSVTLASVQAGGITPYALRVRVKGGGGAGGGCAATTAAQLSAGGGGGEGAYAESTVLLTAITFPVTVTVPAAAVGSSGAAGANGGDVSFGTLVIAKGGAGGSAGAATTITTTGAGVVGVGGAGGTGAASTGQIKWDGNSGGQALAVAGNIPIFGAGGGANTVLNYNSTPTTAVVPGTGGQGAANLPSQSVRTGATAAPGYVIVEPLFR